MTETRTLLRQYAEEDSERAFQELVERYIDLVYSTALRIVNGDSHAAADVTQMVFVRLSQKAASLSREVRNPVGWLHRDTCYVAATLVRGERRRQIRERQAVEMNALNDEPDTNLTTVLPMLDEAINELGDDDREAIMLRFFEQRSFRALGETVGSSEDAARMRVNRALEKLHGLLRARGVATVSVGALTTILGAKAVHAAPVGLAASVVKGISSGAIGGGASSPAVARPLAKSLKLALVPGAALVLILGVGIYAGHRAAETVASRPAQTVTNALPLTVSVPVVPPTQESVAEATNNPSGVMIFHTIEADSGIPLSGTKILVAYYSSPTNSEDVNLETDAKGTARIDFPRQPFTSASILVTAAGHVPMTASFSAGEQMPTNYVMKLAAGKMIEGVVVDEEQQPVANAKIELSGPGGFDITTREHVFFGRDTWLSTDANGRWWTDLIPTNYDSISAMVTHSDFAITATNVAATGPEASSAVLILRKGVTISGTVMDSGGQPIADASIRQIDDPAEMPPSTKSDENGGFSFAHVSPGNFELSVQANGFTPVVLDTTVSNGPVTLNFKLDPGHILRGHVVDESGNPVTNAAVWAAGDGQGSRKFEWSTNTDAQGRFQWDSAPARTTSYDVSADGFDMGVEWLQADGTDHEIKLLPAQVPANANLRIRGIAVDADTGQPLDEFKVLVGRLSMWPAIPPEFVFETDGRDGQFDFRKNMQYVGPTYQIQIQKDGYAPAVSTNLLVRNEDQILTFSLHKDAGFSGDVILPNGNPAANATVFLADSRGVYMDEPGKVRKEDSPRLQTQADKRGHFSFAPALNVRGFVVIDDEGCAEVPMDSFSGRILLQPWGRIEGRLLAGGRPGAGQTIWVSRVHNRPSSNTRPLLAVSMQTTTDDAGNFVFEKVPPGERHVSQRLTPPTAEPHRVYQTQEKVITVAPGVVTRVELGGSGRIVTGRATLTAATQSIHWRQVAAELSLKLPDGTWNPPHSDGYRSIDAFLEASRAYAKAFWSSERGRELELSERGYAAYCAEDGSFSIPDVPPGQYDLQINVRQQSDANPEFDGQEVGMLKREINVPESEDGKDHEVLDLGTLDVPAVKEFRFAR